MSSLKIVHVLSQEGQPYGSERRSCNYCGTMLWGGSSAPQYVDNWEDWRASTANCSAARARTDEMLLRAARDRRPDVVIKHVDSSIDTDTDSAGRAAEPREGIAVLVAYMGGLEPLKDRAICAVLGNFVTGMGYLFTSHERDITAMVPEADLSRVLCALRAVSGVTIKMKIGRAWVFATEGDA